jgi:hypothetical protein
MLRESANSLYTRVGMMKLSYQDTPGTAWPARGDARGAESSRSVVVAVVDERCVGTVTRRAAALAKQDVARLLLIVRAARHRLLLAGAVFWPESYVIWHDLHAKRFAYVASALAAVPDDVPVDVIDCDGSVRRCLERLTCERRVDAAVVAGRRPHRWLLDLGVEVVRV